VTDDWTDFRLCFSAGPGIKRVAGWVCFHDGAWWVKRHLCGGVEDAPWVQAKTRSGCIRYLARWVLLDIKKTGDADAPDPRWPRHVVKRAKRALELHGKMSAMIAELPASYLTIFSPKCS